MACAYPINAQQSHIIKPSRTSVIDGNVPAGSSSDGKSPVCASKVITWDGGYTMWSDQTGADAALGPRSEKQPCAPATETALRLLLCTYSAESPRSMSLPLFSIPALSLHGKGIPCPSTVTLCFVNRSADCSKYKQMQDAPEIEIQIDAISHMQTHTSCLTVNIHQQWIYPYLFF